MALKDIAINIKATGVDSTAQGMKTVENAAESMGRKVNSATASSAAAIDKMVGGAGQASTATGRVAAEVESAATKGANAMHNMHGATHSAFGGMTELEQGIHGVVMRVMNLTMAAALIAAPFVAFFALVKTGITTVDDFSVSVLQIAAQLTQMQAGKGGNLAQTFQSSAAYANVLAEKMEEIDANSFASNKGLMAMLQTMTMQGTVLDVNNEKQIRTFTSLSNAIAMYTQGQDQEIQARQEMRSLLTGEIDQNSQLARVIDTQIKKTGDYAGGLKELVTLGKEHGDTLERLAPYLVGIDAASSSINKTWSAAKSSFDTIVNKITREGFKETLDDAVNYLKAMGTYLEAHAGVIREGIQQGWVATKLVIEGTGEAVKLVGLLIRTTIAPALQDVLTLAKATSELIVGIPQLLMQSPGTVTALGIAAYSAIGGVAGLTAAWAAFSATVTASMASNPVGWVAMGLVAVYEAAKPAMASLDALAHRYAGLNLTGEAYYNAEKKRAAEASMLWEEQKQKALWMYKEGGIPLNTQMKKALNIVDVPKPAPSKGSATDDSATRIAEQQAAYNRRIWEAQRALVAQGQKDDIAMSEIQLNQQLSLIRQYQSQGVISEKEALDKKYALEREQSLKKLELLNAEAHAAYEVYAKTSDDPHTDLLQQTNDWKTYIAAVAAAKRQAAEIAAADALKPWENAASTAKALLDQSSAAISLADSLGDTVAATKLQIIQDEINRAGMDKVTQEILKQRDALKLLKVTQEEEANLTALINKNLVDAANLRAGASAFAAPGIGSLQAIEDQLAAEKAAINAKYLMEQKALQNQIELIDQGGNAELNSIDIVHKARMAAIEAENKARYFNDPAMLQKAQEAQLAAEKGYADRIGTVRVEAAQRSINLINTLNTALTLSQQKQSQELLTAEQRAYAAKFALVMRYADVTLQAMGQLGEMLMEGNRRQFEQGKELMATQAIMAAALAIVQAYAQLGPIGGSIAVVGIGATTKMQIDRIEQTQYEPRATGGPVKAGGYYLVGEQGPELIRMGSAGSVIPNNALARAGEEQLKATRENTRAITRVADGLTSIADLFTRAVSEYLGKGLATDAGVIQKGPAGNLFEGMEISTFGVFSESARSFRTLFDGDMSAFHDTMLNFNSKVLGWSSAFGIGNKWGTTDSGISLSVKDGEISGESYIDRTKKGGWFTSDKKKTFYSALDDKVFEIFSGYLDDIGKAIDNSAAVLGQGTDFTKVQIEATKISTAGKTADQIEAELRKYFADLANRMVETIGGPEAQEQLSAVTRFGESSYDALMRITEALQTVNEAAAITGNTLLSTAQDVAIANAGLASDIIDLFGGAEKFMSAIDKYSRVVNTDAEYDALKLAAAHRQIASALADEKVAIPETVAEYRRLVEATDITSPLYATLIGLADQFGVIGEAAKSAMDQMKDLQATLFDLKAGDSTLSPESRYNVLSTRFSSDAALALAGNSDAIDRLTSDARDYLDASKGYYGSGLGYQDDYSSVTNMLTRIMEGIGDKYDLNLPAYASGGYYSGGSALMGEEGPELVDSSPGYVYRADQTEQLFNLAAAGAGDGASNAEIAAILKNIEARLAKIEDHSASIDGHSAAAVKVNQAGFQRVAEAEDSQSRSLREMVSAARRAQAA